MWSLGCIFFELLKYKENGGQATKHVNLALFNSSMAFESCSDEENKEQLKQILACIGHEGLSAWSESSYQSVITILK